MVRFPVTVIQDDVVIRGDAHLTYDPLYLSQNKHHMIRFRGKNFAAPFYLHCSRNVALGIPCGTID